MDLVINVTNNKDPLEGEVYLNHFNKYVPFMVEDVTIFIC